MIQEIQEQFCSYEVSRLLRKIGFNEKTFTFYIKCQPYNLQHNFRGNKFSNSEMVNAYSSPTHEIAMWWLREKYKLHITVDCIDVTEHGYVFTSKIVNMEYLREIKVEDYFYSYEEAVENALLYTLNNLIKN